MEDDTRGLTLLGSGSLPAVEGGPSAALLESFPNRFMGRPYVISICFPEYTSLCPVTGQPDFGAICVEYIPDSLCVESKSFKLYMFAWPTQRAFMESVTNTILDDMIAAIEPCWCRVKGLFVPRGGTQIHVFAEEYKNMDPARMRLVREVSDSWKAEPNPARHA